MGFIKTTRHTAYSPIVKAMRGVSGPTSAGALVQQAIGDYLNEISGMISDKRMRTISDLRSLFFTMGTAIQSSTNASMLILNSSWERRVGALCTVIAPMRSFL